MRVFFFFSQTPTVELRSGSPVAMDTEASSPNPAAAGSAYGKKGVKLVSVRVVFFFFFGGGGGGGGEERDRELGQRQD